jgi:hypothetical protein
MISHSQLVILVLQPPLIKNCQHELPCNHNTTTPSSTTLTMSTISSDLDLSDVGGLHYIVKRYRKAFSIKEDSPIPSLEEVRECIAAAFPEPSTIHPTGASAERMCGIIKSVFDEGLFHFDALKRREKFHLEGREKWDEKDEHGDGEDEDTSGKLNQ